jgi:flagellar hook-basal body complex protein FliE
MSTTPFNAATTAYGNVSRLISQAAKPGTDLVSQVPLGDPAAASGQSPNFAQMLSETVQGVVDTGKTSDQMAIDMVSGKADVVDMVTAISETEMAIESMVAVRDRVISAYEEIMRMPI